MAFEMDFSENYNLKNTAEIMELMVESCRKTCEEGINNIDNIIENITHIDRKDLENLKGKFQKDMNMMKVSLAISSNVKKTIQHAFDEPEQKDRIIQAIDQLEKYTKDMSDACNKFIKIVNSTASLYSYEDFSKEGVSPQKWRVTV